MIADNNRPTMSSREELGQIGFRKDARCTPKQLEAVKDDVLSGKEEEEGRKRKGQVA